MVSCVKIPRLQNAGDQSPDAADDAERYVESCDDGHGPSREPSNARHGRGKPTHGKYAAKSTVPSGRLRCFISTVVVVF